MSDKQIDIALKKVDEAQFKLGHSFSLGDFKELIEVGLKTKVVGNKDATRIIIDMVSSKK